MDLTLIPNEHVIFNQQTNRCLLTEKGAVYVLEEIFGDEEFQRHFFNRENSAQMVDALLVTDIRRKIIFEAILGNPKYLEEFKNMDF